MHIFYPPLKREQKLNQFDVSIIEMVLFQYVKLAVCLFDSDGKPADWRHYTLTGDDYTAWSSDDTYIVNFVKQKLREESESTLATQVVTKMRRTVDMKKSVELK